MTTGNTSAINQSGAILTGSYSGESSCLVEAGFNYGTSASMGSHVTCTPSGSNLSAALSGLQPNTKYYYQAYVQMRGTGDKASHTATFTGGTKTFTTSHSANVTTGGYSNLTYSGVTISGSYSNATGTPNTIKFVYGKQSQGMNSEAYWNDAASGNSGSFSVDLTSLSANTTYNYKAYIQIGDDEFEGDVRSFTTPSAPVVPAGSQPGWLEMPAVTGGEDFVGHFGSGKNRNYSYDYSYDRWASLWVAYPLTSSHTSGSNSSSPWRFNPQFSSELQMDMTGNSYGTMYGESTYSKGHQLPNADRKSSSEMNQQCYYVTNQLPQIQQGFNGSIWSTLENAVRSVAQDSKTDTLYVVTGPTYQTVGGNETVNTITAVNSNTKPHVAPIANYFWKVLLKVKRTNGVVTSASAIGIWMEHKVYPNSTWQNYVVSVDFIEQKTGIDFFANLPDSVESVAEQNSSWTDFNNFDTR